MWITKEESEKEGRVKDLVEKLKKAKLIPKMPSKNLGKEGF
jgi:hypothetical protein